MKKFKLESSQINLKSLNKLSSFLTIGIVAAIAAINAGSFFTMAKKIEPNVIRLSDNKTFRIDVHSRLNLQRIEDHQRELTKSYVLYRENYNYFLVEDFLTKVHLLSDQKVFEKFKLNNLTKEYLKKYNIKHSINIETIGYREIKKHYVEIMFDKFLIDNSTQEKTNLGRFSAYIKCDFNNDKNDEFSRVFNPSRLRVIGYDVHKI